MDVPQYYVPSLIPTDVAIYAMRYRSRQDIITMIINSARAGATRSKILYTAYLSYAQLVEYLQFLQENDLLVLEEETQLYRPTERGLKFLNISNELNEMALVPSTKKYYREEF